MNINRTFKRSLGVALALTSFFIASGGLTSVQGATVEVIPSSEQGTITTGGNGVSHMWTDYVIIKKDGKPVFCVDPSTAVINGTYSSEEISDSVYINGNYYSGTLNSDTLRKMELVAYYGYYSNPSDSRYVYTQALIWEQQGFYVKTFTGSLSIDDYEAFKSEVESLVNNHAYAPSWEKESHELLLGQSLTLTDTNNVVQNLDIPTSKKGYNLSRTGNQLTITPTEEAENGILAFMQAESDYVGTSLIWRKPSSQTLAELFIQDPQNGTIELTTIKTKGDYALRKIDFEGNGIEGVEFDLYRIEEDGTENKFDTYKTDSDGYIRWVGFEKGRYYAKEVKAKDGYITDNKKYYFEIKVGQKVTEETTIKVLNYKDPILYTLATNLSKEIKEVFEWELVRERAYIANTDKGREYVVRTYMNDYDTKEGRIAVQEKKVIGTGEDMVIDFEYPVLKKTIGHKIVFGEELLDNQGNIIKTHFDWENEKETVYVRMPKIKTIAKVNDSKVVTVGKDGKITDTIHYEDFEEGSEVFVRLEVAKYGTNEVVGTYETLAKVGKNGEFEISPDNINTKDLPGGKYVIFETVFEVKDGKSIENIISEERNNTNEEQSFLVEEPILPSTGSEKSSMFLSVLAMISFVLGSFVIRKEKCK